MTTEDILNLKEQFDSPDTIAIPGGEVSVISVTPKNLKTLIPVIVAPGWLSNAKIFEKNIITLSKEGRRVISFNGLYDIETAKNYDQAISDLHKITALIKTLEKYNIEKVDVIAHSEGGIYTTTAAKLYPERFRNLVLMNTAGIIEKNNVGRLLTGFTSDMLREIINNITPKERRNAMLISFRESSKLLKSNPVRAIKEVLNISATDISETLKYLKSKGIGIAVIHGVDDKLFSFKDIEDAIGSEHVHIINPVVGSHNAIYLEAEKYTKIAETILTELESHKR